MSIIRTNSDNSDFHKLIAFLDRDLEIRDGSDHPFYAQFNKIDKIKNVVLYYEAGIAVGCGAFKEFNNSTVEIKRMFVDPDFRGKEIGKKILEELEKWASEMKYIVSILETGIKQPEAIRLYQKSGYKTIPNFEPYVNVENSVCMGKSI